jgi:hypothetical protein
LERETDLSLYLRGVSYFESSWLKVIALELFISSCSKNSFNGDLLRVLLSGLGLVAMNCRVGLITLFANDSCRI